VDAAQGGRADIEARTRMTPGDAEFRLYFKGELLRSEMPRGARTVAQCIEEAERDWRAKG
jgi:hypothetical protein